MTALAALAEDPSMTPSTHVRTQCLFLASTGTCTPVADTHTYAYTDRKKYAFVSQGLGCITQRNQEELNNTSSYEKSCTKGGATLTTASPHKYSHRTRNKQMKI